MQEALACHERRIKPAVIRRSRRCHIKQVAAAAIAISADMKEYAGGFILGVVNRIREEGVEANRLTSLNVIPRLGASSGIGGLQYLQRVRSGTAEFVGIDGIGAADCYGLNQA